MAENDKLLGVHFAEDDDTQRIRAWWKKNGMGIVAGVAIGLVGVGGFKGWQAYTLPLGSAANICVLPTTGRSGMSAES